MRETRQDMSPPGGGIRFGPPIEFQHLPMGHSGKGRRGTKKHIGLNRLRQFSSPAFVRTVKDSDSIPSTNPLHP